jgi:hypothetical protein
MVIDIHFPVAPYLVGNTTVKGDHIQRGRGDTLCDSFQESVQRRGLSGQVDKEQSLPRCNRDGDQPIVFLVEQLGPVETRDAAQAAVEAIRPTVVDTGASARCPTPGWPQALHGAGTRYSRNGFGPGEWNGPEFLCGNLRACACVHGLPPTSDGGSRMLRGARAARSQNYNRGGGNAITVRFFTGLKYTGVS